MLESRYLNTPVIDLKKQVNTSRLRKSSPHLLESAAHCCRFCVLYVAVMYSTWPLFVFRSRCAKCLRVCGLRSTKMSSSSSYRGVIKAPCRICDSVYCMPVRCPSHWHAFHRRSLGNNKYVILGSTRHDALNAEGAYCGGAW